MNEQWFSHMMSPGVSGFSPQQSMSGGAMPQQPGGLQQSLLGSSGSIYPTGLAQQRKQNIMGLSQVGGGGPIMGAPMGMSGLAQGGQSSSPRRASERLPAVTGPPPGNGGMRRVSDTLGAGYFTDAGMQAMPGMLQPPPGTQYLGTPAWQL